MNAFHDCVAPRVTSSGFGEVMSTPRGSGTFPVERSGLGAFGMPLLMLPYGVKPFTPASPNAIVSGKRPRIGLDQGSGVKVLP